MSRPAGNPNDSVTNISKGITLNQDYFKLHQIVNNFLDRTNE